MIQRRILSIWLPHLAIERWKKTSDSPPEAPVVLTIEGTHGLVIHAVTQAAAERGARSGARLTDARALDPALVAIPADPSADEGIVKRLAAWAQRWSPLVEVDAPNGLRFDVSGVAHLFGGEQGLIADVLKRFAALGLTPRVAIAPTAAAAWALAHYSRNPCRSVAEEEIIAALSPLPVAALRLDPQTARTLERLGLKTVGALLHVPRLALTRRFRGAEDVGNALDRALGRMPEPLTAAPHERPPQVSTRLEEPIAHPCAAGRALELLVPKLAAELERRHLGARQLAFTGFRVDGSVAVASVATSIPSRDPAHLQRLLADKAAALDPGFGFDAFALQASWAESLASAQESLVEEPSGEREVARLIDRLSVKLGSNKVSRPEAYESHLPERASGWMPAIDPPPQAEGGCQRLWRGVDDLHHAPSTMLRIVPLPVSGRNRPQRLLDRPEAIGVVYATPEGLPRRFVWRRAVHDIARVEGPERIAPEWWRQSSTARLRDYYRVEDSQGRRYWIYREGVVGDGRGGPPAWYLHGLFG